MVYFEPHDRLGDPQSRDFWYPWPQIPKPMKPYHRRWQGWCKLSDHTWAAYPTVRRCPTLCISFGGGGLPADNTPAKRKTPLNPPPQTPPFLIWLWGGFKQDIRFPRTPPPPSSVHAQADQLAFFGSVEWLQCPRRVTRGMISWWPCSLKPTSHVPPALGKSGECRG